MSRDVGDLDAETVVGLSDEELALEHQHRDGIVTWVRAEMGMLHAELERRAADARDVAQFGEQSATAEREAAASLEAPAEAASAARPSQAEMEAAEAAAGPPGAQTLDMPAIESTERVEL